MEMASPSSSSSICRDSNMERKLQNAAGLTIQLLREITDSFSNERKIGQGAYGTVYKGVHANGEEVAVKLLHNNLQGTDDQQFKGEFENLMRLEHPNIVQLVGYCYETYHKPMMYKGETIYADETNRALCFEYMRNGSLQKHISDECDGLDWHTRYKIIKGTCEGLKYLHEGFKQPIYHMDLKPDNILLDENMMPKLGDFGLCKLYDGEQSMVTQNLMGTIGYLPPEYLFEQIVSKKLDIFSLGVVMTKIIAGPRGPSRRAEMTYEEFIDQIHENWRKRLQQTWHSSQPLESYCQQVNICIEIALRCMDADRHKRPSIVNIIKELNETETVREMLKNDRGSYWTSNQFSKQVVKQGTTPDSRAVRFSRSILLKFRSRFSKKVVAQETTPDSRDVQFNFGYTFAQLAEATKYFASDAKVGAGSFGTVYRGKLPDGREVVIKRGESSEQMARKLLESAFRSELTLSRLHHKHLVGLVGYCKENNELLLVYEYMKNGSFYNHLRGSFYNQTPVVLLWKLRIKLLLDASRGIDYLHSYAVPPIVHRNITSSNILLDGGWVARVSDFGLSLKDPRQHLSMMAAGTVGYTDPEYYALGHFTVKSDVYSFGVVMLEALTGKPVIFKEIESGGLVSIVDYAQPSIVARELSKVLDVAIFLKIIHFFIKFGK